MAQRLDTRQSLLTIIALVTIESLPKLGAKAYPDGPTWPRLCKETSHYADPIDYIRPSGYRPIAPLHDVRRCDRNAVNSKALVNRALLLTTSILAAIESQ